MPRLTPQRLEEAEDALGHEFDDLDLLRIALTHSSAARTRRDSNERMEFLGDSILGAVVCEELYHRYPEADEGELTRIKSIVVSRLACARVCEDFGLEKFLHAAKGLNRRGLPMSIKAAITEGVIGAIYLDAGYDAARDFILDVFDVEFDDGAVEHQEANFKSLFQQRAQQEFGRTPRYEVLKVRGPEHSKKYRVMAVVGREEFCPAWGETKKQAEQRAAGNALHELDRDDDPPYE